MNSSMPLVLLRLMLLPLLGVLWTRLLPVFFVLVPVLFVVVASVVWCARFLLVCALLSRRFCVFGPHPVVALRTLFLLLQIR